MPMPLMDKIIVIDDGKIIEQGSHAELMLLGGKYSKMSELQKEKYT